MEKSRAGKKAYSIVHSVQEIRETKVRYSQKRWRERDKARRRMEESERDVDKGREISNEAREINRDRERAM